MNEQYDLTNALKMAGWTQIDNMVPGIYEKKGELKAYFPFDNTEDAIALLDAVCEKMGWSRLVIFDPPSQKQYGVKIITGKYANLFEEFRNADGIYGFGGSQLDAILSALSQVEAP